MFLHLDSDAGEDWTDPGTPIPLFIAGPRREYRCTSRDALYTSASPSAKSHYITSPLCRNPHPLADRHWLDLIAGESMGAERAGEWRAQRP